MARTENITTVQVFGNKLSGTPPNMTQYLTIGPCYSIDDSGTGYLSMSELFTFLGVSHGEITKYYQVVLMDDTRVLLMSLEQLCFKSYEVSENRFCVNGVTLHAPSTKVVLIRAMNKSEQWEVSNLSI